MGMFSSNQKLEVSGCLNHDKELYDALEFALRSSGRLQSFTRQENPAKCVYQITDDGKYYIGWAYDGVEEGWNEYPFDFDLNIIAQIVGKHLDKQKVNYGEWDGSYEKGFLMEAVKETIMTPKLNGLKEPFYGIVSFEPYTCFYSK